MTYHVSPTSEISPSAPVENLQTSQFEPVDNPSAPFRMSDLHANVIRKEHDNKSAPTGAATPSGRGLADRKEHDRLMGIMPSAPDPASTCPEPDCGLPAIQATTRDDGHIHERTGVCANGHLWTVRWFAKAGA